MSGLPAVGILHPGAMGSSVGASARTAGCAVYWVSKGRSEATRKRAAAAGLSEASTLDELAERCALIISVCPPAFAREVAEAVVGVGFSGVYVDANAISPKTTRSLASLVEAAGARYVDGGIIGGPAWKPGTTRLYLSGVCAAEAAEAFRGGPLQAITLAGPVGAASALKMAYAAWTKGTVALLAAILAVADREGVREALVQEWALSSADLASSAVRRVRDFAGRSWRFVSEMQEISGTFADAGLPGDFHAAAAEIYRRLASFKDQAESPDMGQILRALLRRP